MAKTIEIYVDSKEVVTQITFEGRPLAGAGNVHYRSVKELAKTEKMLSEGEKAALQLVETLCAKTTFKLQVIVYQA